MALKYTIQKRVARRAKKAESSESGRFDFIKNNIEQIKISFLIVGAIVTLLEYKSKDYLDRVKNSADIVEKFYASDSGKSLSKLDEFYRSKEISDAKALLETGVLTKNAYIEKIRIQVSGKYRQDLTQSINGLKAISICGMQGRCESKYICMHLAREMQDLRCNYSASIAEISKIAANCIVDEINYFVDKFCVKWIESYIDVKNYSGIKDNICLYNKKTNFAAIGDACIDSIIYKDNVTLLDRFLN